MLSATQRNEVNRQNAQLSTGPRTAEGRAAVAQNRTIHNLTGETVLLPGESQQAFSELRDALLKEHAPLDNTELGLVERLAYNQWRLNRIAAMETEILANMAGLPTEAETPAARAARGMLAATKTVVDAHTRLLRYETSTRRGYDQALTQLRAIQKARMSTAEANRQIVAKAEAKAFNAVMKLAMQSAMVPKAIEKAMRDSKPSGGPQNVTNTTQAPSGHGRNSSPLNGM